MKLEWLDDILAVIRTGSLSEASKERFLTQPAFSRRIQAIERYIGADLFDRDRKPLQLKPSVLESETKIRQVAQSLRDLAIELKRAEPAEPILVLACQHAISTAVAPQLVKVLSDQAESRIRLRSANRDECFALLVTGKADIVLTYQAKKEALDTHGEFVESSVVGSDELIPVISATSSTSATRIAGRTRLDVIRYPDDVFLGRLFNEEIMPDIDTRQQLQWIAETGLTTAALQFALSGIGIAWVPRSLAKVALANATLVDLSDVLPALSIDICAMRLQRDTGRVTGSVWQWLLSNQLPIAS
ncbi:hypothetical protein AB833_00120 [Chromatiales bacterium (ex Bugula neritina AB1)]|nr:hypothetical protein AB833_00120 [Chromatiales bacterium (ex Bugula neritina AB1)]